MGTPIRDSHFPNDTTPTTLSEYALSQLRYSIKLLKNVRKLSFILRECDHRANSILKKHNQVEKLSQMPVVLLPLHFDREPYSTKVGPCQRSVVIRYDGDGSSFEKDLTKKFPCCLQPKEDCLTYLLT